MNYPKVSIIVPCFNEPSKYILESLNSLKMQTFSEFECLVIDESTIAITVEACAEFCKSDPRFKHLRPNERLGLAASLNYGFGLARGKYVARFDADDVCDPMRLEKQIAFLDQHPEIDIIGSSMRIINSNGKVLATRIYPCDHMKIEQKFVYTNAIAHPTVMLRKDMICREQGPYRPDFRYSEDLELWLRLLAKGVRFANLSDLLVNYRQESTYRPAANWDFNARARRMHMSPPYLMQKVFVAVLLSIWAALPKLVQELIYKKMFFSRHG